jgi:predicted nucleotidyltransferase
MLYPDFEEFIESLNAHRVRYLIIGGYAVAFHARPRATKDIDVLVDPTTANAKRAIGALVSFLGSPAPNITVERLTNPRTLVVLGVAPVRIDILTSISGVESFAAAWKRRINGRFGRTPANYIALEDLISAKAATTRLQDKADLAVLERALASRKSRSKKAVARKARAPGRTRRSR